MWAASLRSRQVTSSESDAWNSMADLMGSFDEHDETSITLANEGMNEWSDGVCSHRNRAAASWTLDSEPLGCLFFFHSSLFLLDVACQTHRTNAPRVPLINLMNSINGMSESSPDWASLNRRVERMAPGHQGGGSNSIARIRSQSGRYPRNQSGWASNSAGARHWIEQNKQTLAHTQIQTKGSRFGYEITSRASWSNSPLQLCSRSLPSKWPPSSSHWLVHPLSHRSIWSVSELVLLCSSSTDCVSNWYGPNNNDSKAWVKWIYWLGERARERVNRNDAKWMHESNYDTNRDNDEWR